MSLKSQQSSLPSPTSFGSFTTNTETAQSVASSLSLDRLMTATHWDGGLHKGVNGDSPESSKMGGEAVAHAQALSSHLYHSGFLRAEYSDIDLHVLNSVYKLHRIVLARSPYLAHLIGGPGLPIRVPVMDGTVTDESVRIVLENLYSPAQSLVTATNARSVLATAFTFGGMPDLCSHAYNVCRQSISPDTVLEYVQWIDREGATPPGFTVTDSDEHGTGGWREDAMLKYGEWSQRLKQDIITFIIRTLPSQLASNPPTPITANTTLINTYAALPYILLKRCIESPAFKFGSDQERFQFAKKVVAVRKQSVGPAIEESVVLAFKGDAGSAVHITRKPKRKAALWKVEK